MRDAPPASTQAPPLQPWTAPQPPPPPPAAGAYA